jgi:hypothetical protein
MDKLSPRLKQADGIMSPLAMSKEVFFSSRQECFNLADPDEDYQA